MTLHMGILFLALLGLSTALVCPDGGMCEDRSTCCRNTVGGYGCCPLQHAECCSDHLHCCYEGTVCDLVHSKCVNKTVSLPWLRRVPTKQSQLIPLPRERVKAIICPDQESECPDETTCCQLPDGSWGCCPLAKAVCCEDKLHCCPEGTLCDTAHSECLSASLQSSPMLQKLPSRRRGNVSSSTSTSVSCPGGKSSCPDTFTCCLLKSGDYGCCPYPEAMCCSDLIHCCPANTMCDLEHGICKSGETSLPLLKKIPAAPKDVLCPDKAMSCPDETTCCLISTSMYGCCPMPDAVCCTDLIHCCPSGTKCDLTLSACVSTREEASKAVKIPAAATAMVAAQRVGSVRCNESVVCADGNTCCELSGGEWACCPLPEAMCCADHLHCCPHGTVCNLKTSTCDDPSGNAMMPWFNKTPAIPSPISNSKCDKSTSCPGKSTCCKSASGQWACCPLPQAVCCDDHIHCCEHGTVCNLESETCDDPSGLRPSLQWVAKVPAVTSEMQSEKCDKQTMCPRGSTCCKKDTGLWACCPLPQAVCCNDHEHCCPDGYTCNVAEQTCDKAGVLSLPWVEKIPALSALTGLSAVTDIKCDDKTSCPSGTTCCKLPTGAWGCCPLVKAVCCEDHTHCCPQAYTCNMQSGTCEKKKRHVPIVTLLQSKVVQSEPGDDKGDAYVACDGTGEFLCPKENTCCKISASAWACCPSPRAVCCADSKRCCPAGHSCDLRSGGCTLQSRLTWDTFFRRHKERL
ncbi:granulin b [Antennarius striatus]|uniref:granulin b n=1 Tax=Antennarius striatus TaxID=241820 RepID=UPI0035B2CF46